MNRSSLHAIIFGFNKVVVVEVSGVYTSPFLHTDERKMALRARKVYGAYEKRASGPGCSKPD